MNKKKRENLPEEEKIPTELMISVSSGEAGRKRKGEGKRDMN